jgi:anti-sigma B factor antagonist
VADDGVAADGVAADGGDRAILRPVGRLDLQRAQGFREAVAAEVAGGRTRIVVDLSEVGFVDSSGLGALIAALKISRQAGGDLRITGVTEQVATILELTQMHRVLAAHATVDEALEAM